jgi:DNA-3-methyladenine glycosylase
MKTPKPEQVRFRMKLPRKFFERPTLEIAQDLLGKYLVRFYRGKKLIGQIVETEAYIGEDDLACHASRGRTSRTEVMYGPAGHAYVYLVYGIYDMFNIVTEKKGFPAAVLIRGLRPIENLKLINGPGKLCQWMRIDKSLNNEDLTKSKRLWLVCLSSSSELSILRSCSEATAEDGRKTSIKKSPRVGIPYAKHCRDYPWRFTLLSPAKRERQSRYLTG